MPPPRRSVTVDGKERDVTELVSIHVAPLTDTRKFTMHDDKGNTIARCDSAKRLSDWAFEAGAQEVRMNFDLKVMDGEP